MAVGLSLMFGVAPAGELRFALQSKHIQLFGPFAYDAVRFLRRRLSAAWRQPPRPVRGSAELDGDHADRGLSHGAG